MPTAVASLCVLLAAGSASARQDDALRPATDRQDVARSYQLYESALAANPPEGENRIYHGRRFDWLSRLVFRGQWNRGVRELDRLTELVLPAEFNSPAHRAARAIDVTANPPVFVTGDIGGEVRFDLRPIYDVEQSPGHLQMRILDGEQPIETFWFPAEGANLVWQPPAGITGRLAIEVGPVGLETGWPRGHVDVVDRKPSRVKAELLDRLDTLAGNIDVQDNRDLVTAIAATRSRIDTLLTDTPDTNVPTIFLADLPQLMRDLPAEVAKLEAGENPYALKPGDYWRTFNRTVGGDLDLPSRVYAPPLALSRIADGKAVPLVIALHGAGGDENLFMDGYGQGMVKRLAEEYGFILVSPLTYPALADARSFTTIVETVGDLYTIDEGRIFAIGHSLGAITAATWGQTFAGQLAGVALIAGGNADLPVPTFVAAAEFDRIFPADRLEAGSKAAQQRGVNVRYVFYPQAAHASVVTDALPEAMAWLMESTQDEPIAAPVGDMATE